MTPQERKILEEAEQQAFDTAQAFYDDPTSGIPAEPLIEETENSLEGDLFGLEFAAQPTTLSMPSTSSGGGEPPVCPLSAVVTFHDVLLDCGCAYADSTPTSSFIATDVAFNDVPICLPIDTCSAECFWWDQGARPLLIHVQDYLGDTSCSVLSSERDTSPDDVFLVKNAGTYYLWAVQYNALIFYGTTTNISLPISNDLVCDPFVFTDYDNAATDCVYGGLRSFNSIGHSGTASVVLQTHTC